MTAEQLKRTDIIHNYIMAGSVDPHPHPQQHPQQQHPHPSQVSYHYIPPVSQQQRWQPPQTSGVITSAASFPYASALAPNSTSSPSPPPSQPGAELSRIYLSPRSSPACSPSSTASHALAPKLVELQVGIAANSQPLNLSKKSPSPSPRPLSAPQPAPQKVVKLEA